MAGPKVLSGWKLSAALFEGSRLQGCQSISQVMHG